MSYQPQRSRGPLPRLLVPAVAIGAALAVREALARRREADLKGKVALVTGGSRGLGFLLARELAACGCRVAILARDGAQLERARMELAAGGADVLALAGDVGDRAEVQVAVTAVEARFGPVDVLVNNAGIIDVGPLETMTVSDFQRALDVMYWGVVYPTLAVLPVMRRRRQGRIVNITSIGGRVAVPHLLPYVGAKFAATGFSEGLRAELAGTGITVTTVTPGLMRTGSHLNARFKGKQGAEFTWFSLGASLPLVSMDAERAARQVVRALRRGDADVTLSVTATVMAKLHGLAPGLTADALGLVNGLVLPDAGEAGVDAAPGAAVQARRPSALRDRLTALGRAAARRMQQPGADTAA
jgi:NAD(P)-dependent dehydrogenase (short-subunit alcohol dehydrogenase family)